MASIGKIALNLFSGEAAAALAHINFNFSVVKMDAPVEFQDLGKSLSKKRKFEAEDGAAHGTARKLGALFVDDMPPIPHLAAAYGARTSEIASNLSINPKGDAQHGPLASYIGADGTSIWAAATSGRGALEVHLLACLLARIWSAPEATTLWTELVSARKEVLDRRTEGAEFHINALTASRIEVSRIELANWDASARAWIRSADRAKTLQQKQLLLIVDNIGLKLISKPRVYDAILPCWVSAMQTMESIISGVSQKIQSPEVVLGLSSWHLYPDMYVASNKEDFIKQNDNLVPGHATITFGLQKHISALHEGISWSLPLSRLRYYGKAVIRERTIATSKVRMSFSNFVDIALGAAMADWWLNTHNVERSLRFISALSAMTRNAGLLDNIGWLKLLESKAEEYGSSRDFEKREIERRIHLGHRRYGRAFGQEGPGHLFGLSRFENLIGLLEPENQISAIRQLAMSPQYSHLFEGSIIRYIPESPQHQFASTFANRLFPEFATVFPHPVGQRAQEKQLYRRWITVPDANLEFLRAEDASSYEYTNPTSSSFMGHFALRAEAIMGTGEPCGFLAGHQVQHNQEENSYGPANSILDWSPLRASSSITALVDFEELLKLQNNFGRLAPEKRLLGLQLGLTRHSFEGVKYRRLLITGNSVAVYTPIQLWKPDQIDLDPESVIQILQNQSISETELAKHLDDFSLAGLGFEEYCRSLENLHRASIVYRDLANNLVDVSIMETLVLKDAEWARTPGQPPGDLTRTQRLSCITAFESGSYNIPPEDFDNVAAISVANSLYVSELLLRDPREAHNIDNIRHLVGNIGKPGISLLLLANEPEMRTQDLDSWDQINHHPFDGEVENNFESTSAQLELTGDEVPLKYSRQGACDKDISYVEAVIRAYERGIWVGDIDAFQVTSAVEPYQQHQELVTGIKDVPSVLGLHETIPSGLVLVNWRCDHPSSDQTNHTALGLLTSVDCWSEFIDPPTTLGIIRARNNWLARLALTASASQKGYAVAICCQNELCWGCISSALESLAPNWKELPGIFVLL